MKQRNGLSETEKLLQIIHQDIPLEPDYLDEDMMIVDNIKVLMDLRPKKPTMNVIAICTKGKLQLELNGTPIELKEDQLFICPPNMTISNVMISTDFEYTAITITDRALQSCLRSYLQTWNQTFYVDRKYVISMEDVDVILYQKYYELLGLLLHAKVDDKSYRYRGEILRGLIFTGLVGLCTMLNTRISEESTANDGSRPRQQSVNLFNQFLHLLQNSTIKHQSVEYYAAELCVTSKYLTVICKNNSQRTAYDWIQEYTVADIAYYLDHTDLIMKEICNKTGFPNSSFFGKYVKEHLGYTPMEYRRKKQEEKETK